MTSARPASPPQEVLLERERELGVAASLLADAARGQGAALLLKAPAGLGKSTLAGQLVVAAEAAGFLVLSAAGRELERGFGW